MKMIMRMMIIMIMIMMMIQKMIMMIMMNFRIALIQNKASIFIKVIKEMKKKKIERKVKMNKLRNI